MQKNFTLIIAFIIVGIASLYFGSIAAEGDVLAVSAWAGIAFAFLYFTKLYQYSLQIALIFVWGNINMYHGFRVEPVHLGVTVLTVYGLWMLSKRRDLGRKSLLIQHTRAPFVSFMIIVFVLYGLLHFLLCRAWPHIPGEFSASNSTKAYFKAYAPMVLLWIGMFGPYRFILGDKWENSFFKYLLVTVTFNLIYLAYLYFNGFSAASDAVGSEEIGQIYIPIINAVPHHFALRTLGPLAVLFGFAFMTDKEWWGAQKKWTKLIVLCCLMGGIIGSVISGGRAALALAVFFALCISIYRKQVIMMASAFAMGVLFVVLANIFSTTINERAPMFIARPLQYIMIEKGDAMATIDSSSNQRTAAFEAGIEEWQSYPRIKWIGRGVYPYRNTMEELRPILGEEGAFVELNLRAGTLHALIPSALVQYGAVGLSIYYIVFIGLIIYSIRLLINLKKLGYSSSLHTMCLCLVLYLSARLVIDSISATWMNVFIIIMFIIIKSRAVEEDNNRIRTEEANRIEV